MKRPACVLLVGCLWLGSAAFPLSAAAWSPHWRVVATHYPTCDVVVAGCTVQEFGAKGDAMTDDTAAFQAAFRAMAAAGGGTVFAPEGRYAIRGTLQVPTGVTLRGEREQPVAGRPVRGTILMAYAGRGEKEGTPFIGLLQCSGVEDLIIWYPEQDAAAIVPYPFCVAQIGFESATIENLTLVNPYQGIRIGPQNNELNYIKNVCGSPLATGLFVDFLTDTGRLENADFSPDYWSDSGLPAAPARGGPHAHWMLANGTGLRMSRVDCESTAWLTVRGYKIGLELTPSKNGVPGLHLYGCQFRDCGTALSAVGGGCLLATRCVLEGHEHGITTDEANTAVLMFHSCDVWGPRGAVSLGGKPDATWLFQDCVFHGEVAADGGNLSLLGCRFEAAGNHVSLGADLNAATIGGSTFAGPPRIVLHSDSSRIKIDKGRKTASRIPQFPRLEDKVLRPARTDLYVVTDAAWGARKDGKSDDTAAIQKALSAAGRRGGGIVFLPGGQYAVAGHLCVPTGVEIRGIYDVPHHTLGQGTTLRVFAGRGEESAAAFLVLQAKSGMRGLTLIYPEQRYNAITPYPATVEGRGDHIYVVNVAALNPFNLLDFMTHRCDAHLIDYVGGAALKTGIAVGGGSRGGEVRNCQLINHYWNRSPYADCPGVPKDSHGRPIHTFDANTVLKYTNANLDAYLVGDCRDERLFENCIYGAHNAIHFVAENGRGASGCLALGHITDGSAVAAAFDGVGPGGVDFINTMLACLATKDMRYIVCGPGLAAPVRFYNLFTWGEPQYSAVVDGGSLCLELGHFCQYAPFVVDHAHLDLVNLDLAANTAGKDELAIGDGGTASIAGTITAYGMHAGHGGAAAVTSRWETQRNAPLPAGAREISVLLGKRQEKRGLALREQDGESENAAVQRAGRPAWIAVKKHGRGTYMMHYIVEFPEFKNGKAPDVEIALEYFDEGHGNVNISYDSSDPSVQRQPQSPGAWRRAGEFPLTDTKTWKTYRAAMPYARFTGRCNGSDFRVTINSSDAVPAFASAKISKR